MKFLQSVVPMVMDAESQPTQVSTVGPSSHETSVKVSLMTFSPDVAKAEVTDANAKAVKNNDAATNVTFWNTNAVTPPLKAGRHQIGRL